MRGDFDNWGTEAFVTGAARAFFVSAWLSRQEEKGKSPRKVMHRAPPTPLSAYVAAGELMGHMAELNRSNIHRLGADAVEADGLIEKMSEKQYADYLALFGHYCAMQALDEGVSWFDDHAKFPLKLPRMEYNLP
jgi:hypothetical protein